LKIAAGGAGMVLGAPVIRLFSQDTGTQKLSDDLFILSVPGEAGEAQARQRAASINVIAQTTADGVLLVDGGSAAGSDALIKVVSTLPATGPVHTIFNTHWHPEQTGSNERLGKTAAKIIAHENTRLWLTQDITWPWNGKPFKRLPKIAQPNKTFYATGQLQSGVRYGYLPDCAHTDGDLYVFFPKQNVMAVGDAVCGQGWPVMDWWTGGWIGGMAGGLQRLLTMVDSETRIIPARGPVLKKSDLEAQYDMYGTIYERLATLLNRGRGPTEAVAAKPTKEFDDKMGPPDEFVRRAFESLWGYLSPDA
jgi:cyclase